MASHQYADVMNRRAYLGSVVAAAGAVALAGCSSGGSGSPDGAGSPGTSGAPGTTDQQAVTNESEQQVSNPVSVVSATGTVAPSGSAVSTVRLTTARVAGAAAVDLSGATVQVVDANGRATLTYGEDGPDPAADSFGVAAGTDANGSAPVLDADEDRLHVVIEHSAGTGDPLAPLSSGSEASYTLTFASGNQTAFDVAVPENLGTSGETVPL